MSWYLGDGSSGQRNSKYKCPETAECLGMFLEAQEAQCGQRRSEG